VLRVRLLKGLRLDSGMTLNWLRVTGPKLSCDQNSFGVGCSIQQSAYVLA